MVAANGGWAAPKHEGDKRRHQKRKIQFINASPLGDGARKHRPQQPGKHQCQPKRSHQVTAFLPAATWQD